MTCTKVNVKMLAIPQMIPVSILWFLIKNLREESKMLPFEEREIITEMMDDISRNKPDLIVTYKICLAGTGSTQIQP